MTDAPAPDESWTAMERLLRQNRPFAALALATAALQQDGETHEGLVRLARIETHLGSLDRARASWRRALQLGDSAEAHAGLGAVLVQGDDLAGGIAAFRQGLRIDPANVPLLTSLAVAHLYEGDFAAARRAAARALQIDPGCHDARLARARAELALGNQHLAEADLDRLAGIGHKPNEVMLLRIGLQSLQGAHEAALFEAAELCDRHPDSAECLRAFREAFQAFAAAGDRERYHAFLSGLMLPWSPAGRALPRPEAPADGVAIDVIVPVHNALPEVEACLDSLRAHSGPRLGRLILVDDASESETRDHLAALHDRGGAVTVVATGQRLGFTGAVLKGIAESRAPVFVVLNSDTQVSPGWLDRLYAGLMAEPATAMVGPMSNNAAWQSLGPVFAPDGRFADAPVPDAGERQRLAMRAEAAAQRVLVPLPLLHGFCVMLKRAAYDAVGGFDVQRFPEGYGETQDLSLRLTAAGHGLRLVADCIVHHERGASISGHRRESLSRIARRTLHDSYSALNYLSLEMAACVDPLAEEARAFYANVPR